MNRTLNAIARGWMPFYQFRLPVQVIPSNPDLVWFRFKYPFFFVEVDFLTPVVFVGWYNPSNLL